MHRRGAVDTWHEALALLDRYQWVMLWPLEVHPSYRGTIWLAAVTRAQRISLTTGWSEQVPGWDEWRRLCVPQPDLPSGESLVLTVFRGDTRGAKARGDLPLIVTLTLPRLGRMLAARPTAQQFRERLQ